MGKQRYHDKLRLGYLAESFTEEKTLTSVRSLLLNYDRERFEVYCYSCRGTGDSLAGRIAAHVRAWREPDPGERITSPEELAGLMGADCLDILVDLGPEQLGSLSRAALFLRPAPVQIVALGYMHSTGLPYVDCFLGDMYCDPPEQDGFSETLLRLSHCLYCYGHTEAGYSAARFRPLSISLPRRVMFGCSASTEGLDEETLASWCAILQQVPDSRLMFMASQREVQPVCAELCAAGIAAERLLLRPRDELYMRFYNDVDIMLDTYPQTGLEETCEALYMGVPLISRYGTEHASRLGYSFLMNTGLGDLAAATAEEYVAKAVALARDRELLLALKGKISSMFWNSPVMDGAGYVRDAEIAYEAAWQQHVRKA